MSKISVRSNPVTGLSKESVSTPSPENSQPKLPSWSQSPIRSKSAPSSSTERNCRRKEARVRSAGSVSAFATTACASAWLWIAESGPSRDSSAASQSESQARPRSSVSAANGLKPVASPSRTAL